MKDKKVVNLSFKKGDKKEYDDVINILPLIPLDYYRQDDPYEHDAFSFTETIEFLGDVKIKYTLELGELEKYKE